MITYLVCYPRLLLEVLPSHRNISCDFVAKQMYGFIMDNLNYEPKMIVRHIEQINSTPSVI